MPSENEDLELRRWHSIDPQLISGDIAKDPGASLVQITLSPYDIPEAVRSFFDDDQDAWVIEFRYFSDHEKYKTLRPRVDVSVKVGTESGRLYRIEISAARSAGGLSLYLKDIDKAIASLAGDQKEWRLVQHFKVARRILSDKQALTAEK